MSTATIGTQAAAFGSARALTPVSYTHLTLPTKAVECRSRWWPDH
nr:hypothetical protein [Ralstonia sp. ASV6]